MNTEKLKKLVLLALGSLLVGVLFYTDHPLLAGALCGCIAANL